jgi:hypothetical protein
MLLSGATVPRAPLVQVFPWRKCSEGSLVPLHDGSLQTARARLNN